MAEEKKYNKIEDFIKEINGLNISKLAFSEINERRAEQTGNDMLEVIVLKKVDILAYSGSTIYKYSETGDRLEELFNLLTEKGFEVKRINRNIT